MLFQAGVKARTHPTFRTDSEKYSIPRIGSIAIIESKLLTAEEKGKWRVLCKRANEEHVCVYCTELFRVISDLRGTQVKCIHHRSSFVISDIANRQSDDPPALGTLRSQSKRATNCSSVSTG